MINNQQELNGQNTIMTGFIRGLINTTKIEYKWRRGERERVRLDQGLLGHESLGNVHDAGGGLGRRVERREDTTSAH